MSQINQTVSAVEALNLNGVKYVQCAYVDYNNQLRYKLMPYSLFKSTFQNSGLSWCPAVLSFPTTRDMAMENHIGEVKLMLDKSTIKQLPWRPEVAQVFGKFTKSGSPWPRCPRVFLDNQLVKAKQEYNLKFSVGFELEFLMLDKDTGLPLHYSNYCEDKVLQGNNWKIFSNIIAALEELGIPVWQFHGEGGNGQFEVAIGPFTGSILEAADSLVLARQTIYNIAAEHNVTATFIPKLSDDDLGTGAHVHFSVTNASTGKSVPEETLKHIIAGVLHHLPSILTIITPTTNSFRRLLPNNFAGAYQIVGTENKDAPLRLVRSDNDGQISRFELKTPDGTSNPYFMLGSIIGCGLDGLQKKMALPAEVTVDPSTLPEDQRPPMLPSSFAKALNAFKSNLFIVELFGTEMVQVISKLREFEDEHYRKIGDPAKQVKYFINKY